MSSTVQIGDDQVDMANPCAIVAALRKVQLQLASGAGVVRARFGEDDVQFSASSMSALRDLIGHYEGLCSAMSGRRARYAKRIRYTARWRSLTWRQFLTAAS
jgi:hypothetical protein